MNTTAGMLERVACFTGTVLAAVQGARESIHEIATSKKRKYYEMLDPENMYYHESRTTGAPGILGEESEPDEELGKDVEREPVDDNSTETPESGSILNEELDEKVEHEPPLVVSCRFCSLGFPDEKKKQNHESGCSGNVEYSLRVLARSEETPQKPGETGQEHMARCAEDVLQAELPTAPVGVHDATCELVGVHLATPVDDVHEQPPPEDQRSVQEVRRLIHLLYAEDIYNISFDDLMELVRFDEELAGLYKARGEGRGVLHGQRSCAISSLRIFRERRGRWLKPTLFSVD